MWRRVVLHRILWTREPRKETLAHADRHGVEMIVMPALYVQRIAGPEEAVRWIDESEVVVITSSTTLDVLEEMQLASRLARKHVISVGGNTTFRLQRIGAIIVHTAFSADAGMKYVSQAGLRNARHIGGADAAGELELPRLAIYTTMLTYPETPDVDATAIFSPKGARSVITPRNEGKLGQLLSIGQTTSEAIRALGRPVRLTSTVPNECYLLEQYIESIHAS